MRIENTEVYGFKSALRGMRNPMNSWDKSDSGICKGGDSGIGCEHCSEEKRCSHTYDNDFKIGKNDMKLAQKLIRAGSEHRKFMRQIFVSVDITAPLYWWKEFDTYKVGTVANSTSTMHKLATTPITLECFEIDDYDDSITEYKRDSGVYPMQSVFVEFLEHIRRKYLETNDKKFWKELIRWLPESWLQTRTVTMSYENLFAMCSKGQRRFHRLSEWSDSFINWARTLPYAQELIFIDEVEE